MTQTTIADHGPVHRTLFSCGFRPFFLLAAVYGIVSIAFWTAAVSGGMGLPVDGDVIAWHVHELVFGFAGAALAGFLLTAVPEWTSTSVMRGRALRRLVVLWTIARLAAWSTAVLGVLPMAVLNLAFLVGVASVVARPLWHGAKGRHRVFLFLVAILIGLQAAIYACWALQEVLLVRALVNSAIGIFLLFVLVALGRISMVIVNAALEKSEARSESFVARPPRRAFAMGALAMFLVTEHILPYSTTSGWLALAAAAAVLNVLNDWHCRGAWRDFYVQVLCLVYVFMALGLAFVGASYLWGLLPATFARHVFAIGSMALAVLAVLTIAGQRHTGRDLAYDWRIRMPFLCLIGAVVARSVPAWLGPETVWPIGYGLSSLLWCAAFAMYLATFWRYLTSPRVDGLPG